MFRHRAPLPGRRTVPTRFPIPGSPFPVLGRARPEESRRPGGNDRAGRLILVVHIVIPTCKFII